MQMLLINYIDLEVEYSFCKAIERTFENLILTNQVQIQSNLRNDILFALEDINLNISCLTDCGNNIMSESYPNYDNMNIDTKDALIQDYRKCVVAILPRSFFC